MPFNVRSTLQNEGMKLIIFTVWLSCNAVMLYLAYQKYCVGQQFYYLRQILGESMCISRSTAFLLNLNCFLILLPVCKSLLSWVRMKIEKYIKGTHRRLFNHYLKFHYVLGVTILILSSIHVLSHCVNCYRFYDRYSSDVPELNISPKKEEINVPLLLTKLPVYSGIAMVLILIILLLYTSILAAMSFIMSSVWKVFLLGKTQGTFFVAQTEQRFPPEQSIERSHYEIFWYSHHLSMVFYGFLIVHGLGGIVKYQVNMDKHYPGCLYMHSKNISMHDVKCYEKPKFAPDPPQAWKWVIGSLFLYVVEKILRYFSARKPVQVNKAVFHQGDVLEIRMTKPGFSALPGQYIRLNCREISAMEWHPFTLTQCPSEKENEFTVHIKVAGDWTGLLASQLQSMVIVNKYANRIGNSWAISIEDLQHDAVSGPVVNSVVRLQVDGPYGSPFQDVSRFPVAVVITAGIGATPFAALLNQMRQVVESSRSYGKLSKLYFIWVCKTHDDMSWFVDILHRTNSLINSTFERSMMETHLFLTRSQALSDVDPSMFDEKCRWLAERLAYRRPNWEEVMNAIDSNHQKERIGVFYCGPKVIHPVLHRLCNRTTTNKNSFIFHKENF